MNIQFVTNCLILLFCIAIQNLTVQVYADDFDSYLRKNVKAGMHESKDDAKSFDTPIIQNATKKYTYEATITSTPEIMEYVSVSPIDCEMEWNAPRKFENHTTVYFNGEILPTEKATYYSSFNGIIKAKNGGQGEADLTWGFYGKLPSEEEDFIIQIEPDDNFQGRSLNKFGVGEKGIIRIWTTNTPLKEVRLESNNTTLLSVSPSLQLRNYHDYDFSVGMNSGVVYMKIIVSFENDIQKEKTIKFTVCRPSSIVYKIIAQNLNEKQQPFSKDVYATSMNVEMYLQPSDVSFSNLGIFEGECFAEATGCLSDINNLKHQQWPAPCEVEQGDVKTGCALAETDYISSQISKKEFNESQEKKGEMLWKIPCFYTDANNISSVSSYLGYHFLTLDHHYTIEAIKFNSEVLSKITKNSHTCENIQKMED
ncbi:MAG: hypothetical protein Q4C70_02495 [Planctomycetia bacterium]|nr:hypothetical protein [Planctomycetia bacterium]